MKRFKYVGFKGNPVADVASKKGVTGPYYPTDKRGTFVLQGFKEAPFPVCFCQHLQSSPNYGAHA